MTSYRWGAIFYILWGIMHVMFAAQIFLLNTGDSTFTVVQGVYSDSGPARTPEVLGSVIEALMNQHAWNLFWFGAFAAVVGVLFNWRNNVCGYWVNLVVVSMADIGFIGAILVLGYVDVMVGIWGPVLWVLAVIFSTVGIKQR